MVPKVFSKLADVAQRQEYIQCYLFLDCLQPALNSMKINKRKFMPMPEVTYKTNILQILNLVSYITHDVYTELHIVLNIGLEMPFLTIKQK